MMKNKLATIAVGASLIIGGGTVDFIDRQGPTLYAYQYIAADYADGKTIDTATGTLSIMNEQPKFSDVDGDGLISVKVTMDKMGVKRYQQTDEGSYRKFAKENLIVTSVPTAYKISLAEAALEELIPTVEAATIAYGSSTGIGALPNCASCTSLTYAHDVTGTDPVIVISVQTNIVESYPNFAVTYGGSAATFIAKENENNRWNSMWVKTGVSGVNNVVITRSSGTIIGMSASYSGVHQSSPVNASSTASQNVVSPSLAVTTTVDNSWLVGSWEGNRSMSSWAAGTTERSGCCGYYFFDSNGAKTPAGSYSLGGTQTVSGPVAFIVLALSPTSDSPTITKIIEPIITWW